VENRSLLENRNILSACCVGALYVNISFKLKQQPPRSTSIVWWLGGD
jgi:hypothetical protein